MTVRNKYGAKRCEYQGISFASMGERDCFIYFQLLEKAKLISHLKCQIKVNLTAGISLKVDFTYLDCELNQIVYAEFKGFQTRDWLMKKKLWKVHGPGLLRVYQGRGTKMKVVEEIEPVKE